MVEWLNNKVANILILNIRAIWARSYVRIVGANREPSWIIFETLLPLLGLSAYVFVYRALDAPPEFTGFVILGGVMTAYWLNILWSMAAQFYWEKMQGQLELFMIAPISTMSILLGMAIGGIFMTSTRAIAALALGIFFFGVRFHTPHPFILISLFFLTLAALYGLGMLTSSLFMLWGREVWHTVNLFQEPVYLISGFYFPVKHLGFWVAASASFIPLTLGLDGMRQVLYGPEKAFGFLSLHLEVLILFLLSILFLYLSHKSLAFMEKIGKREGRLTLRWQ
jgi:ABC-2 type transport system permease protein